MDTLSSTKEARINNGKSTTSLTSGAGKTSQPLVKEWNKHFLTPYTKINSKWIKNLNVRPETIKLLEESIGKILSNINHSRILYGPLPRILEIKAKINKWDLIKLKSFCATKETISKVKESYQMGENNSKWRNRQRINLKNIQATAAAQFQKNKWPNQKMGQRSKQTFLQRRHSGG